MARLGDTEYYSMVDVKTGQEEEECVRKGPNDKGSSFQAFS